MSLIEQATKRLEALQRSGAELPGELLQNVHGSPSASEDLPTPEALMRALEARGEHPFAPGPAPEAPAIAPPVHRPAGATPAVVRSRKDKRVEPHAHEPGAAQTIRRLELDLERMKARGFVTPDSPQSQIADEFRVIKRPIIKNALGKAGTPSVKNGNLVMVTSSLPGEGKTFTSVNLAMSIAMEYDNTVLLVDGDVAHPSLPGLLGVHQAPGLLDLLTNDKLDVAEVLVKTNVERLSVIPAGAPHRRATELLASEQMGQFLQEIASRYSDRIVIFDSPPLLATTEARVLAAQMGQIVMVVAAERTSHSALTQALATVDSCEVVLMMLNRARQTDVGAYYGYYAAADAGR